MAKVWINPAFKDKFSAKKEIKKEKPAQEKTKENKVEKPPAQEKEIEKEKKEEPAPEGKKPETKKEEKSEKKPEKRRKKRKPASRASLETKYLQYLEDNKIPIEIKFIGGKRKLNGMINWYSETLMCFKPQKKNSKDLIFNRIRLIYYRALEEVPLSAEELLSRSRLKIEEEMIKKLAKRKSLDVEKLEPLIGKIFTAETLEEELKNLDFTEDEITQIVNQVKAMAHIPFDHRREFQRFKDEEVPLTFHMMENKKMKGILQWHEHLVFHIKNMDGKEEYNIPKSSVIYIEIEEVSA